MKQLTRSLLNVSLLFAAVAMGSINGSCSTSSCNDSCSKSCSDSCGKCHSVYIPRSANSNTAYKFLPFAHKADMDSWNGGMALGFEYQRSFKSGDIAKCMFGAESLSFKGSQVADRDGSADILADYFGLSPWAEGTLCFHPRIQNFNMPFESYLGLDCWLEGLYGQVNFTLSHQKRQLFSDSCSASCNNSCNNSCGSCSCETSFTGTGYFPAGYMDNVHVAPLEYKDAFSGKVFGDMQTEWTYGKFAFCDKSKTRVAGVDLILGYDFWHNDCAHLGAFFIYTAPTGNKPSAEYIFSPVVGNGKHHELGGGITSHWEMWSNNNNKSFTAYLDGHVTTMLKNCQKRSLDFAGKGCMSRYMLLKEMVATTSDSMTYGYTGNLINAINVATKDVDVKVKVKGDASLRFVYKTGNWDMGLGYNIYGQSREHVCIKECASSTDATKYAFKGCEGTDVFYYSRTGAAPTILVAKIDTSDHNNATASTATITNCDTYADNHHTMVVGSTSYPVDWTTFGADNLPSGKLTASVDVAYDSQPAVLLDLTSTATFDVDSARAPRQLIHKGFATLNYTWTDCDWSPYLGIGGEVEGGTKACDHKQWGVWLKGGISF